jgi:hypothetical protein
MSSPILLEDPAYVQPEDEATDDAISEEEATASLNGEMFSDGEENEATEQGGATRTQRAWRVDHSSGNHKYKREEPQKQIGLHRRASRFRVEPYG